jgi:hypothetical protein
MSLGAGRLKSLRHDDRREINPVLLNIRIFARRDDSAGSAWREPAKPTAKRQQPKAES